MDENVLRDRKYIHRAVPVDCTEDRFEGDHLGTSYAVQEFRPSSLQDFWLWKQSTKAQLI